MLILAVDTSTRAGSLAILHDRRVLGEISGREETAYSDRLFRDLSVLRSRANFGLNEVDVFAVAAGPGSFTGLRVGLTAVKAWAEVYGRPIAAISGLEAIAALAQAPIGMLAPFLNARREQVFGATYRRGLAASMPLELVGEEALLSTEEFLAMVNANCGPEPAVLVSPTPEVVATASVHSVLPRARIERVSPNLAPAIGLLGFERAGRGALIDALHLDANYVRRSDAELFRKGA